MILLLAALGLAVACFLCWWLFIETEGVYLGRRVVIALYDIYAERYDRIKRFDALSDQMLVCEVLLDRVHPLAAPLILDVGTGTGRLPLLLASNGRFLGHVIGLDLSRGMLDVARAKVAENRLEAFVTLMRHDAMDMPFADGVFDAVTCLEALEFMPDPEMALEEMIRVLRPGGLLLTTIRIDTRWMPDRTWSEAKMRNALESRGMRAVEILVWQEDYSQVWAHKSGESEAAGMDALADLAAMGAIHR